MKNPEMLKFVSDQLKPKKLCENGVIKYVPDQYETQQMVKMVERSSLTSLFLTDTKMCDKAIIILNIWLKNN